MQESTKIVVKLNIKDVGKTIFLIINKTKNISK